MNLPSLPTFPATPSYPLVPFPPGANDSDTLIPPDIHLNLTVLQTWDYSLYANATISNESHCFLAAAPLELHFNGTWLNYTSCFSGLQDMGPRGGASIGLAFPFALALVLCLVCLNRLGKMHLKPEKRFKPIGRRWQWYWAIFACAFAMVSLLMNVDVDRVYVVDIHIIITSFLWFIMQLGTIALVWEAVRHWGSWQERQIVDPDPFTMRDDDRRSKVEFWLPLWFYFCLWLNFFMIIPRNWEPLMLQRSDNQTETVALPAATDTRFKVGAFSLILCWVTITFSLLHSVKHYKLRPRGHTTTVVAWLRHVPLRFALQIPLVLLLVAYQILGFFDFDVSILKVRGNLYAIFAGGYGPTMLILFTQVVYGLTAVNEDVALIRQRTARDAGFDRDLGIIAKPAWWRLGRADAGSNSMMEQLTRNVREISGSQPTGSEPITASALGARNNDAAEKNPRAPRQLGNPQHDTAARRGVQPDYLDATPGESIATVGPMDGPPPYIEKIDKRGLGSSYVPSTVGSDSAETNRGAASTRPPIRSMLDV